MRRMLRLLVVGLLVVVAVVGARGVGAADPYPASIALPNGWLPEGIVTGAGPEIYSGSRANGAIYAADLRTGQGRVLVQGVAGRMAVGLSFDHRTGYIYASGGNTGRAFIYDSKSGAQVGEFQLAPAGVPTFVNDVIVTADAAYFTDSMQPVLYRLPLGSEGQLPAAAQTLPLGGEYAHVAGFNANGIEALPGGTHLIIVHSTHGVLYRVDAATGEARTLDLGGVAMTNGDGILLHGSELYVVQNRLNQIAVLDLASDYLSGTLVETITSPSFDVPTTIAQHGALLYVVNARFTTPPGPDTTYNIVRVEHLAVQHRWR